MHIYYNCNEVMNMAEICLDCWNKLNGKKDSKWRYVISWDKDLCEECGQYKRVIVRARLWSLIQQQLSDAIEYSKTSKKK